MAEEPAKPPWYKNLLPKPKEAANKNKGKGVHSWRSYNNGKVYGIARRKGESNPMKWGLSVDDSCKDHPKYAVTKSLPPRGGGKGKEKEKVGDAGGEGDGEGDGTGGGEG